MSDLKSRPINKKSPYTGSRRKRSALKAKTLSLNTRLAHEGKLHSFVRHVRLNGFELLDMKTVRSRCVGDQLRSHDPRVYQPLSSESIALSSSLVDPLTHYRFRLGGYTTLTMTTGTINTFLAADPSAAGWNSPEWATLSSLFSEFRLVQLGVRVVRSFPTGVATPIGALAICSNLGTAVAPGSYAAVADNADASMFTILDTSQVLRGGNSRGTGYEHVMNATNMGWSQVTTPTVEPYAGAPGSIQFYSTATAGPSVTDLYQVLIWGIYDFRIRV